MRITRSKARVISDLTIDQNIDMNSYDLTEVGNITLVKNSGVQLLAGLENDGDWCGETVLATAGQLIAQFQTVFLHSGGKVMKSDADASATMPIKGIAVAEVALDAEGVFLIEGFIRIGTHGFAVGALLYASETAGAITNTAPSGSEDMVQRIGIVVTDKVIWFRPDLTMVEVA